MFANFLKWLRRPRRSAADRTTAQIGRDGESAAAKHLTRQGLRVVERNWSCSSGEIDIICQDRGTWVFVEVKSSHRRLAAIPPEARVNWDKQRRLRALAKRYLKHRYEVEQVRFDVVAVWWENDDVKLRHYENAF